MNDKHNSNRMEMLTQIQQLSFLCVDLNLFLDTHPDNERAAMDYSCYSQELNTLKREFEEIYGPLNNFGNGFQCPTFRWVEEPWPWEHQGR